MAIHDYDLANSAGIVFRADLNNVLAAIVSQNSSLTEPTTLFAYMWWADTTTAILKQRNAGNSAWNSLFNLTTGQWLGSISGNAATVTVSDAAADTTTWPMLATSQTGNLAPATDAGLTYDASTNTLTVIGAIDSSSPSSGIGYVAGAGGSVSQLTNIGTAVTINKRTGQITTQSHNFTAFNTVVFIVNNNTISANDIIILNGSANWIIHQAYYYVAGQFWIYLTPTISSTNNTIISFAIIKGAIT